MALNPDPPDLTLLKEVSVILVARIIGMSDEALKYEAKTLGQLITGGVGHGGKFMWLMLKVPIFL
jgi:hypothetical protein